MNVRFKELFMDVFPVFLISGIWVLVLLPHGGWMAGISGCMAFLSGNLQGSARRGRHTRKTLDKLIADAEHIKASYVAHEALRLVQNRSPESWPRA